MNSRSMFYKTFRTLLFVQRKRQKELHFAYCKNSMPCEQIQVTMWKWFFIIFDD